MALVKGASVKLKCPRYLALIGHIQQRARRIEVLRWFCRLGRWLRRAGGTPVGFGIDDLEWVRLALVLDPGSQRSLDGDIGDGHDLSGGYLAVDALDGRRSIPPTRRRARIVSAS